MPVSPAADAPGTANFLSVQNLIKGAVAVLAFFPGLAVYLSLVEVPPDFVGAAQIISFSLSILVVVSIPIFSDRLRSIRKGKVAGAAFLLVLLGAAALMFYTSFARSHVLVDRWTDVQVQSESELPRRIIPLRPSADIVRMIEPYEGRHPKESYELALEGLPQADADLLRTRMGEDALLSFALMVTLLLLSQVLLVAPPVALAWRLVTPEPAPPGPARASRRRRRSAKSGEE